MATGRLEHLHRPATTRGTGTDVHGRKPIIIIQGGQWGSEAKGLIAHKLTIEKGVEIAIRTGTVNAGHTVYFGGKAYVMQQLPVSWVRPGCQLVLGPGAYISPEILIRELEWIGEATGEGWEGVVSRLCIDYRCGIHLPEHTDRAAEADRHHSIGTTGKGCSEAVVDKIMGRDRMALPTFDDFVSGKGGFWRDLSARIVDTVVMANSGIDAGKQVMVEGTQGSLLDLHLGDYPYTTHKQTQAASWLAEAGLSPALPLDLWMVMRMYPIKVAGNSGPMPGEVSWVKLARQINEKLGKEMVAEEALKAWEQALRTVQATDFPEAPSPDPSWWTQHERREARVAASEMHAHAFRLLKAEEQGELKKLFEFTTVTKKLRRVAEWNWSIADKSLMLNRPTHIALTFMNYMWPYMWGATAKAINSPVTAPGQHTQCGHWFNWVQTVNEWSRRVGKSGPVGIVSFGPQIEHTHMLDGGAAETVQATAEAELMGGGSGQ